MTALEVVKKAVDRLYKYRDHYFEDHDLDRAIYKTEDVSNELETTMAVIEEHSDKIEEKAELFVQRGRALNVMPNFDQNALDDLSKAVKLDPRLVDGWNHLGECYWKNGDIDAARNCFTGALNHLKNKISLRNLSMVLRQVGKDHTEKATYVGESVDTAKEAVQLDISDGISWFILGNAYLSLFFAQSQLPKTLKLCMSAYQQAEKDPVAKCNPDLYYNRATAYKYQEEYQLSILGFSRASLLDPTWSNPQEKKRQLIDYLLKVVTFIETKGKLKGKRLTSMLESLTESDLGPYAGGSYTGPRGNSVKLDKCSLIELQKETNPEKVVVGKVVCSFMSDDPVPFTLCMVDAMETCYSVTIYNMAEGCGPKIGDSLAIPEPFVQEVEVQYNDQAFSYKSIRVDSPVVLAINGKKLGLKKQAPSVLAVNTKSE